MKAHNLLGISLEDLKIIDDNRLKEFYHKKRIELDEIRVIEVEELERKERELKNAFELLQSAEKRELYLREMNQPTIAMNAVKTKKGISTTPSETTPADINERVLKYQNYIDKKINDIDEKIKKLDQTDATYKETKETLKETKETLERWKENAKPIEKDYSTFDDFQKSEFYQSMSKEDQQSYSKDHFPTKVISITLTFDSFEEATNYIKKNEGIEKAREFVEKVKQKGFKIDPEVLNDLEPQTHSSALKLKS